MKTIHEGIKDHNCDLCGKDFSSASDLKRHIKCVHEGQKDYNCTSAGNDPSGPPSHLSGEMIRRLREKQKMKNAAAVASAVASVAAVTTSGGRQFDKPQPPALPSANSKSK